MIEYLELVEGSFTQEHFDKQVNQIPYVAYSVQDDEVIYNIIPTETPINYFYIESLEDNNVITLDSTTWAGYGDNKSKLEYSNDAASWNSMNGIDSITINNREHLYMRCIDGNICKDMSSVSEEDGDIIMMTPLFKTSTNCNIGGNINSVMFDYTYKTEDCVLPMGAFAGLFMGMDIQTMEFANYIIDASKLVLPNMKVTYGCYIYMFYSCTSLTATPELPATMLAESCYTAMFAACTSLIATSELPATTLADYCYASMFQGCALLTTAPELPAAELTSGCYDSMFSDCPSLTIAPELPATTLAESCYQYMFRNCTSLTTAPELPAMTLADYCYTSMFMDCTALITAPELPAVSLTDYCYDSMFQGCTSLTIAPELPATELADYCYQYMFYKSIALTTAPELPATELADYCYQYMFTGCTSLSYIKCLATNISATDCTFDWVRGVASTGIFVKHPDMSDWGIDSVNGIPIGWTVASSGIIEDESLHYVTFTAEEDNSSIGLEELSTNQTLEYSTDTTTWNTFDKTTNVSLNNGDKIYIRGILSADNTSSNYTQFKMSGKIAASGNCNALWNYQDLTAPLKAYCGLSMFEDCTSLSTAPELPTTTLAEGCYSSMFVGCTSLTTAPVLPATELAYNCYAYMFYNCTSLTTAPELPATTLAEGCYGLMFGDCTSLTKAPELPAEMLDIDCYYDMFHGCTSLTTAPDLPATTLASNCYQYMFSDCTLLTTAPELPATTLVDGCYSSMFQGCTSLSTAPELPAMTLVDGCYSSMFYGCTKLNYIKCLATDISATNCTTNWVKGVASKGEFIKHTNMNDWEIDSVNGIPIGWTDDGGDITEDESLPYVTFTAEEDNSSLGLSFLSTNQTLEYSTDTTNWYKFYKTTDKSLNKGDKVYVRGILSVDNTSTDITRFKISGKIAASGNCNALWNYQDLNAPLKAYCGLSMFQDCDGLTKAPELPATELVDNCYNSMFASCTGLIKGPKILPATTLTYSCYSHMFNGCTNLTTAPELPAPTLTERCYHYMFFNCSNLNYIKCLATDISATQCTFNWVSRVASNGIFVKEEGVEWSTGASSIPTGWTVEDAAV